VGSKRNAYFSLIERQAVMNLAETFEGLSTHDIEEYIRLEQEEHLHLDFKTVNKADLSREDRRNFAICISGFANSDGGLIIWGVDARKNDQEIDCASEPKEIASIKLFVSKLNEYTGQAVSPIVDGVRHKAIETTPGKGFAVTLVPESDAGPYMAKLGEDRYYKRSGGGFYRMEHFDLEDMFGRRQKPKIRPGVTHIRSSETTDDEKFEITIQNLGRAVGKYTGFLAQLTNATITRTKDVENVSHLNPGRATVTYNNNLGVIHPNGIKIFAGAVYFNRNNSTEPVTLRIKTYCENMSAETTEFGPFSAA
jgi:hypothetical protein